MSKAEYCVFNIITLTTPPPPQIDALAVLMEAEDFPLILKLVLSHSVCGICYGNPSKLTQTSWTEKHSDRALAFRTL